MGRVDNLQEELLKTKKSHAFAAREISILRTRIKILEKECKKKDQQIDDLLKNDQFATKSEQKLQLNSLKRKVVQLERALREKSEENARLLSDQNVIKAAETRQKLDQLNAECSRLRKHLNSSIPESEFINAKHQYMEVIDQLTDENMVMRNIIGQMGKSNNEEQIAANEQDLEDETMMAELRNLTLTKKKDVETYKLALNSLINRRNSNRNSSNAWYQKPPRRQTTRSQSANHEFTQRRTQSKFPLRTQPALSKGPALRSKSTEVSTEASTEVDRRRRIDRKLSDANLTSISNTNLENSTVGKEILMPVERKIHSNMYRHAVESDSSSENNMNQEGTPEELAKEEEELPEFPLEVYDAKGNVYYIEPEEEIGPGVVEEDDDTVFDPHLLEEELQKQQSTDTWLEIASSLSGQQATVDEEATIVRTLNSHALRLRMLLVRKEGV